MQKKIVVGALALCLISSGAFAATGSKCTKSSGSQMVMSTIKLTGGDWDYGCKTFNTSKAGLGDGSQGEAQKAYFRVSGGAKLRNVIIGQNGADGIHAWGDATLENITWLNVGEDAFSLKKPGNVTLRNITATGAEDKFMQQNAPGKVLIDNAIINGALKVHRTNGGKKFATDVTVTNSDLINIGEAVFRTDSPNAVAKLVNSRTRNVKQLCMGYAAGKCTSSGVKNF